MLEFTSLSQTVQYALTGLLFIAILAVFFLLIYKYTATGSIKHCVIEAIVFVLLLALISYVAGSILNGRLNYAVDIPYAVIVFISIFFLAYSIIGLVVEYRRNQQRLSPTSVKEALDNLNSGICFADETGRIVLMNYIMSALISSVIGSYPQTLDEIKNALTLCIDLGNGLYRFADERVWLFHTVPLQEETLLGFTQTAAEDVTELYETNEQLQNDNEKLKETNEQMQKMLERLADRIRDQETLNLKMRIHDDIGTSLIAITKIMNGNAEDTLDMQLNMLQNAVGYFSNEIPKQNNTIESVRKSAENVGVALLISGEVPDDMQTEELITLAARECVTNCIHHARGNQIQIKIKETEHHYFVRFTNNGEKSKEKITEGGGLSSLRKRIENAGGEMMIEHSPEFVLFLNLPKRS